MHPFFSWYLLLPAALSVLYGYTQVRCSAAMGIPARRARRAGVAAALSGAVLTTAWAATGFPLPAFYALTYLLRAARVAGRPPVKRQDCFLFNLSCCNTMGLHLVLIGAASLIRGETIYTLLGSGFWRVVSVSAVLAVDCAAGLFLLRRPKLPRALAAEARSEEARPFMAFLWFCTAYLLADSFLCVTRLEPLYPPLFLVGSVLVMMYFVLRFMVHIDALIREEHLKDEHERLAARLAAAQEKAGVLKRIVDRDALTGTFSRRRLMDQVDTLTKAGWPFCMVFLDLDGLKGINDAQGHDAGDRYLAGFARAVESRLREGDWMARVGGDEFLVLMSGCGGETARRRMEGIRAALEAQGGGGSFRFSYGVAPFLPGEGKSAEELVEEADRAMYQDKEQRRLRAAAGRAP